MCNLITLVLLLIIRSTMKLLIFVVVTFLLILSIGECKKMWGSRKKKEDTQEEIIKPARSSKMDILDKLNKQKSGHKYRSSISNKVPAQAAEFEALFNMYLNSFEDMLESADFETIVNPQSIRQLFDQFPEASDIPEISSLLNMPEFNDPVQLKMAMREGLKVARSSSGEISALLSDPEKLSELLSHLPPEIKKLVDGLRTGDFTSLKDFVVNLPGLENSQRRLLLNLLDGNTGALASELRKSLADGSQVEAMRQQLLAEPALIEALGLPAELLQTKERWADAMAQGVDALLAKSGEEAAAGPDYAGKRAAAEDILRSFSQRFGNENSAGEEEVFPAHSNRRRFVINKAA